MHYQTEESQSANSLTCDTKEKGRWLKEQFLHGMSDEEMMIEIIRELTAIKQTNKVTSEQVLCWTIRVESQKVQNTLH